MTAPALTFTCANCALDWPEPFCSLCGRQLTKSDLTPTSQEPSSSRKEATLGSQPEGSKA